VTAVWCSPSAHVVGPGHARHTRIPPACRACGSAARPPWTWTVPGALSAFHRHLNAPKSTSALTRRSRPTLAVRADGGAHRRHGQPDGAFIAGIGDGCIPRALGMDIPSPPNAVHHLRRRHGRPVVRVGALRKAPGTVRGQYLAARCRHHMRAGWTSSGRRVSATASADHRPRRPVALRLSVGNNSCQPDLHLLGHRPEPDHAEGWAARSRSGNSASCRRALVPCTSARRCRCPSSCSTARGDRARRHPRRPARAAHARPLPGRHHAGLAIFMQSAVLATPCFSARHQQDPCARACPTRPTPSSGGPRCFGLSLESQKSFALFSLGVLLLSVFIGARLARQGRGAPPGRRAGQRADGGGHGDPILRTKLLAFGLSGFMAGYAGVCFAFATQQLNTPTSPSTPPPRS